jgi:hypothetical protein
MLANTQTHTCIYLYVLIYVYDSQPFAFCIASIILSKILNCPVTKTTHPLRGIVSLVLTPCSLVEADLHLEGI